MCVCLLSFCVYLNQPEGGIHVHLKFIIVVIFIAVIIIIKLITFQGILNGAQTEQDTLWTIAKEQHTPLAATFKGPENGEQLRESLQEKVHGPTSEILAKSVSPFCETILIPV